MSNLNKTLVYGLNDHDTSTALRIAENGELLVNNHATRKQECLLYDSGLITTTSYAVLVDLSAETDTNYANIDNLAITCKLTTNNANADVKIGVITRIDAVDADISWLISIPFTCTNNNTFLSYINNYQTSSIRFEVSGGELVKANTNSISTSVALVNTALTLPSPRGAVTPAVGDVICVFAHSAHNFYSTISAIYHTD